MLSRTLRVLREDVRRYSDGDSSLLLVALLNLHRHPALAGVIYYRVGRWLWLGRRNPFKAAARIVHWALYPFVRLYSGLDLSSRTEIGPGFCVLHFGPTLVHPDVNAGEHLTLLHGVSLGCAKVGSHVTIGTGAVVRGPLTIGDRVTIGAGAVVVDDAPDGTTLVMHVGPRESG